MTLDSLVETTVTFVRAHEKWAFPIVFALAFGESLAFVSLLLPATVILFGLGALIGEAELSFVPLWASAALGAAAGDWLSFWLGAKFEHRLASIWPLSRHPSLLPRGHAFFKRWGVVGVFMGRFFGPLRASVPLVAGAVRMDWGAFQLANITSAMIWAAGILGPGAFGLKWLREWL